MDKNELKKEINDTIYDNLYGDISGESLNGVLNDMVDTLAVDANPPGEPVGQLDKIGIGGKVYSNPPGPQGDPGEKGETGPTGPVGPQGKSAYQVAVDNGYVGTEQEWLASLKAQFGSFKMLAYNASGPQITPSYDTTQNIYLMPNAASDPTAQQMWITVDNGDGATPRYTWEYLGDTDIDVEFATHELVGDMYIDDTHLDNPHSMSLPKSTDVAQIKAKVYGVDISEQKVTQYTEVDGQRVVGGNGSLAPSVASPGNGSKYAEFELDTNSKYIRFNGIVTSASDTGSSGNVGWAFGHYEEEVWVKDASYRFEQDLNSNVRYRKIYTSAVPTNSTHVRITTQYGNNTPSSEFWCYLASGSDIDELIKAASFASGQRLAETHIDNTHLDYPLPDSLPLASDVKAHNIVVDGKLEGVDFVRIEPSYTQISGAAVMGVDGTYVQGSYTAGEIITGLNASVKYTEVAVDPLQFDAIRFRGMIVREGSTSDMLNLGWAFGYYEDEVWRTVSSGHWHQSSKTQSYTGDEYLVDVPQEQGVTHFRVTSGYYTNVPASEFYIFFENGKTIPQMIEDATRYERKDIVGKEYCNMSASTFSTYAWHKNLVEFLGMSYTNVGMGGSRYRMYPNSAFSLTYQTDEGFQNRVIINQVANILTSKLTDNYYPDFIVSCAVLNDTSKVDFLTGGVIDPEKVAALIGTAEQAMAWDMPSFDTSSLEAIATTFGAFISSHPHRDNAMFCMRVCMQLLSENLPLSQVVVCSSQYMNNNSYSMEVARYFIYEQRKLCRMMSIPFIELTAEIGINEYNYTSFLGGDNLHPNTPGQNLLFNYMKNQLNQNLVVRK